MHLSGSFFTTTDDDWFIPTEHTRGPWDENHCHAGPPTGLIARALRRLLPAQRLTRLTVNLSRPIPHAGFRIETAIQRSGRTVSQTTASIIDADGKVCAVAAALHMTPQTPFDFPSYKTDIGSPHDASPGPFPIQQTLHNKPAFNGSGVETRYPDGHNSNPGPTIAWLRTVPLLPDEAPEPFEKICPMADCGNAFGRNADASVINFMNPDLTILLHRDPLGDWMGTQVQSYWEGNGIGMADALLFDMNGAVGRAIQTLLLRPTG